MRDSKDAKRNPSLVFAMKVVVNRNKDLQPLPHIPPTDVLMDDDLIFGASVWSTDDNVDLGLPPPKTSPPSSDPQFEDQFEDFNDLIENTQADAADDDFGDFGDFGDADAAGSMDFEHEAAFEAEVRTAGPSHWCSLKLDPMPSRLELTQQVKEVLEPIWGYEDPSSIFTGEGIREVEGIGQILVTPERCLLSFHFLHWPEVY